jgi:hypothetical protein
MIKVMIKFSSEAGTEDHYQKWLVEDKKVRCYEEDINIEG